MKSKGFIYFVREECGNEVYISDAYTNLTDAREEYAKRVLGWEFEGIYTDKDTRCNGALTIFWFIDNENLRYEKVAKISLEGRRLY